MNYVGDFPVNATVYLLWNTNGQDGASITRSTDGTLKIYKNVSATERTSLNGVTQVEDFDSNTGVHSISIDLSDNTDAGFYAAGNEYHVVMTGMTIDTKTVNAEIAHFSIERANGILALLKNGTYGLAQLVRSTTPANTLSVDASNKVAVPDTQKVDLNTIKTQAVTATAGVDFDDLSADIDATETRVTTALPNAAPGASGGLGTTNGTKLNQTVDLTAGQSIGVSGDFSATMKTSLNAATPASVQNIPVDGSLGVDVKKVNSVALTGDGSVTPWGPA